jgi:transposase InsO family protein
MRSLRSLHESRARGRLGIAIERIKPGHPQQNGRHERMHLTLKKEATRPAGFNSLLSIGVG